MYYKELTMKAEMPEQISTEIMYEIASARADSTELIRISILNEETSDASPKKRLSSLLRILKSMKNDGRIQFFATEESFKSQSTEAVFLQNKYPDVFSAPAEFGEKESFVYIKI